MNKTEFAKFILKKNILLLGAKQYVHRQCNEMDIYKC